MKLPLHCLLLVCLFSVAITDRAAAAVASHSAVDYGADGSDGKDDTIAIQKAIDAAGSGGVVFLPAGSYKISDTLVIREPGVTLEGEGRGGTSESASAGTLLVLDPARTNTAVALKGTRFSGIRNIAILRKGSEPGAERAKDPLVLLDGTYHSFAKDLTLLSPVSGIEIVNGISPFVENISIKGPSGAFGFWLHGSGRVDGKFHKVDAAHFTRVSGGAGGNVGVEWIVLGPNVDGAKIEDARFVAGSRGLVLRGGDPEAGDTRPKYIYAEKFGCDHVRDEGVLIEAGNDVFMTNTWIGQNKNASGFVIGPGFTGGVLLTDLRIRGSGGHGLHVLGGSNIYILNPLIGTNGTNRKLVPRGSTDACGILIERGVRNLRVTGGGVCPMYESGPNALQHYGVRYLGDAAQAAADSVRISGVDTAGNAVGFSPAALSLDRTE